MAIKILRFDLRRPDFSEATQADLYQAAVEMSAVADEKGFDAITLSEHHGVDDGYLPSPLPMAGAMVGRTRRIRISISALLLPLYDPIKVAEDLVVLDIASGGRVGITAGLGYRPEEYAMFGEDFSRRGKILDEKLDALLRAMRGETFEYRGRTVRITPAPLTRPHPPVFLGGQSVAAAKRAARFGLPFAPASNDPEMLETYRRECERRGVTPLALPPGSGEMVFVAEDPDREWREIGPHLLHDARSYAAWQPAHQRSAVHSDATTVEELRAEGKYRILTPEQCIARAREQGPLASFVLFPLCGGIPPKKAWENLQLFVDRVLPEID